MVKITNQQAKALSRMAKWFQRMIVDRNVGTPGLTAEYCQELIEALKTEPPGQLYGVYYPMYCMECHTSFVTDKDSDVECWNCGGTRIVQNHKSVNKTEET